MGPAWADKVRASFLCVEKDTVIGHQTDIVIYIVVTLSPKNDDPILFCQSIIATELNFLLKRMSCQNRGGSSSVGRAGVCEPPGQWFDFYCLLAAV